MIRLLITLALLLAACKGQSTAIKVGHKDFSEQELLAHLLALEIESAGSRAQVHSCGDTLSCQQALRSGDIDLYVEYSGTAALYAGHPDPNTPDALRLAYEEMGLYWRPPLGFDNSYELVVLRSTARDKNISSIEDLSKLEAAGLRIAAPSSYLRRPGDGLSRLLDRHGLRLADDPLEVETIMGRLDALERGQVDVAVLYGTDAALRSKEFVALKDTLRFFPRYDAAILSRLSPEQHPAIYERLDQLSGRLNSEAIRSLNYAVQEQGFAPRDVAARHLRSLGLSEALPKESSLPPFLVASSPDPSLASARLLATRSVRSGLTRRAVLLRDSEDAIASLLSGQVRLAIASADRFFAGSGATLRRREDLEALAVVGSLQLRLLRRRSDTGRGLEGRVGTHDGDTNSVPLQLLAAAGTTEVDIASLDKQLGQLRKGELDALLVMVPPDSPTLIDEELDELRYERLPDPLFQVAPPYLRLSRIGSTEDGPLNLPIDTLSIQVLLVGLGNLSSTSPYKGPAAALEQASTPLPSKLVQALADTLAEHGAPDPILPSRWNSSVTPRRGRSDDSRSWGRSVASVATLLFLIVLGYLHLRDEETEDDEESGDATA